MPLFVFFLPAAPAPLTWCGGGGLGRFPIEAGVAEIIDGRSDMVVILIKVKATRREGKRHLLLLLTFHLDLVYSIGFSSNEHYKRVLGGVLSEEFPLEKPNETDVMRCLTLHREGKGANSSSRSLPRFSVQSCRGEPLLT